MEEIKKEEWNPWSMVRKYQERHELTTNMKSKIFQNITQTFTQEKRVRFITSWDEK